MFALGYSSITVQQRTCERKISLGQTITPRQNSKISHSYYYVNKIACT